MACTVAMQHALSESLLVTMEEWAYTGGIQVSGLDFGFPCPYGALESYLTKDGCRVMTRDPGCRAHFGGAAAVEQPAPAESDAGDRWVPRQLQVLPKVRRRSLRAVALCHVGRLIGRRRSACLLRKK